MTYFLEDLSGPSGLGNTIIYAASLIHGTCLINKSDKTGRNPYFFVSVERLFRFTDILLKHGSYKNTHDTVRYIYCFY